MPVLRSFLLLATLMTVPFGDPDAGLQPGAGRRGVGGVPGLPDPEDEQQQAEAAASDPAGRPRVAVVVDRQLRHGRLGPGGGQQLATSRPAGRPQEPQGLHRCPLKERLDRSC